MIRIGIDAHSVGTKLGGNESYAANLIEALAQNATTLAHLVDAHDVAVETIADGARFAAAHRDVELELRIHRVRLVAPHVVAHAGAAQIGHNVRY